MTELVKAAPTKPRKLNSIQSWDMETDVAIVGFGGAGSCAALEASENGGQVILFEQASASGGSTALSSAEIYMGGDGGTRVQQACGYQDTNTDMFNYLMECGGPQADEAKIRHYVEGSIGHFDWLTGKGVPYKDSEYKERAIMSMTDDCLLYTGNEKAWPFNELAKPCPRGHNLEVDGDNGGPLLMKILTDNVDQNDAITVCYESRVLTLIVDDGGVVVGLVARVDGKEKNVKARKGVILCAGGFVMNDEMLQKYAPALLKANAKIGNPGDTGTGILMGMGVGAAAINMHEGFVSLPYYPPSTLTNGILVNSQGQRFINEDCYHGRVGYYALQQHGDRIYMIFSAEDFGEYQTQSYLGADIAGTGDTIEELEQELKLPEGSLQETLSYYNRYAEQGRDPKFHKSDAWLKPMQAPFAALDCTVGRGAFYPYFTLGGLDSKPTGEVLTPTSDVIQGLYAAGRTTAGLPRRAAGYASGMSVGDATYFGRMAGISATTAVNNID
ncbi:MAG: FAD-dependent oxidoreductase [Pseudomonadales bacterium]